jgi:hypothetical protein
MKKLTLALSIASCLAFSNVMAHDNTYHVTITNTTANHVITPPAVISHNDSFKLFKVTEAASDELAIMAESGNVSPLLASLAGNPDVSAVMSTLDQAPPVILPGQSITVTIVAPEKTYFTIAAMLATTNDAFTSVTLKAPKKHRYANGLGMTYDAGSEDNNELCIDIPGPPCGGTNATIPGDGEGFVTIHNGVHGVGDLVPADLDWRGPTSMVKIHNAGR